MANFIFRNPIIFNNGTGVTIDPGGQEIFSKTSRTVTISIGQAVNSSSNTSFGNINSDTYILDSGLLRINDNSITGSFTQTGNKVVSSNMEVTGNLSIDGTITFDSLVAELTQSNTIFNSGSTIFGDDTGDAHNVTGSLLLSGSNKLNGYSINGISNDTSLTDSSTTELITEKAVVTASKSTDNELNYLRKSFTKVGTVTNSTTASFNAVTASSPGVLTNTSEVDFMFFNNGMLMEYNSINVQQSGSTFLLKVNSNSIGYGLDSSDEIIAFGKFNS
tara:strand:+ start:63 stop:890 length:828 start_codon:yes stop_codon:yes gene_type:complete